MKTRWGEAEGGAAREEDDKGVQRTGQAGRVVAGTAGRRTSERERSGTNCSAIALGRGRTREKTSPGVMASLQGRAVRSPRRPGPLEGSAFGRPRLRNAEEEKRKKREKGEEAERQGRAQTGNAERHLLGCGRTSARTGRRRHRRASAPAAFGRPWRPWRCAGAARLVAKGAAEGMRLDTSGETTAGARRSARAAEGARVAVEGKKNTGVKMLLSHRLMMMPVLPG